VIAVEEWRPVPGYPDYRVSNGDGYRVVTFHSDSAPSVQRYVHHLVAELFIGPRPEGHQVRHFDGNSANNAATNLRYGTQSENELDKVRHGTHRNAGRTECDHGHPFNETNTGIIPSTGQRFCRTCRKARNTAYSAARSSRRAAARAGRKSAAA
jgi:molybdenum cofactor biosynthesis enzyme MoaA